MNCLSLGPFSLVFSWPPGTWLLLVTLLKPVECWRPRKWNTSWKGYLYKLLIVLLSREEEREEVQKARRRFQNRSHWILVSGGAKQMLNIKLETQHWTRRYQNKTRLLNWPFSRGRWRDLWCFMYNILELCEESNPVSRWKQFSKLLVSGRSKLVS